MWICLDTSLDLEIHICPIKMRTIVIDEGKCDTQDETCDDCPVLELIRRSKQGDNE